MQKNDAWIRDYEEFVDVPEVSRTTWTGLAYGPWLGWSSFKTILGARDRRGWKMVGTSPTPPLPIVSFERKIFAPFAQKRAKKNCTPAKIMLFFLLTSKTVDQALHRCWKIINYFMLFPSDNRVSEWVNFLHYQYLFEIFDWSLPCPFQG